MTLHLTTTTSGSHVSDGNQQSVQEGVNLELRCIVDANPAVTNIEWLYEVGKSALFKGCIWQQLAINCNGALIKLT